VVLCGADVICGRGTPSCLFPPDGKPYISWQVLWQTLWQTRWQILWQIRRQERQEPLPAVAKLSGISELAGELMAKHRQEEFYSSLSVSVLEIKGLKPRRGESLASSFVT